MKAVQRVRGLSRQMGRAGIQCKRSCLWCMQGRPSVAPSTAVSQQISNSSSYHKPSSLCCDTRSVHKLMQRWQRLSLLRSLNARVHADIGTIEQGM